MIFPSSGNIDEIILARAKGFSWEFGFDGIEQYL
jgi:hypothetical protein